MSRSSLSTGKPARSRRLLAATAALALALLGGTQAPAKHSASSSADPCGSATIADNRTQAMRACGRIANNAQWSQSVRAIAHLNMATVLMRSGDIARAETHVIRAEKLSPRSAETAFQRANILYLQGDYQASADAYTRAIARGLKQPEEAYFNRAAAYERLNQPVLALADRRAALAEAPRGSMVVARLQATGTEVALAPRR